jgi:hypothetical protein
LKTPRFRSSASLSRVTCCDHRFDFAGIFFRAAPVFRRVGPVLRLDVFREVFRVAVLRRSAMNNSFASQPKLQTSEVVPKGTEQGNPIAADTL